jgi:VIT1/CCC1 family predicted Fe2+/Mn2+ transporter
VRPTRVAATSERWKRVFGDEPETISSPQPGERWKAVFGDGEPQERAPVERSKDSVTAGIAIAIGALTPVLAIVLASVGLVVLVIGGLIASAVGTAAISDIGAGRAPESSRGLAVAAIVVGAGCAGLGVLVLAARGA